MANPFNMAWTFLKARPYRPGTPDYPRVPQRDEESSYANISVPRESPIYGIEPFGEDEQKGATIPMSMANDVLDPISEPARRPKQKEFNPFKPQPSIPPMREERGPLMGGNEAMSRGPLRSRKRGQPDSGASFSRPGFRSNENMPLTDRSMQMREGFDPRSRMRQE